MVKEFITAQKKAKNITAGIYIKKKSDNHHKEEISAWHTISILRLNSTN
jgi:hypothetical protein